MFISDVHWMLFYFFYSKYQQHTDPHRKYMQQKQSKNNPKNSKLSFFDCLFFIFMDKNMANNRIQFLNLPSFIKKFKKGAKPTLYIQAVKILVMFVTKLCKQNIWREIMQRHGKGGVSMTLPPLPVWSKKVSWIQGSEKKTFFWKYAFPHKVATYEFILFLFKSSPDMIEGWMKDVRRRNRSRTKNIEISKRFHLISYKYLKIL